jgi:hypothetical protein
MKKVATLQSKEQAWADIGNYQLDPAFAWIQHNHVSVHPSKMRTAHLFNALRLISDDTQFWHYKNTLELGRRNKLPINYRRKAIANLFTELTHRPDLTQKMKDWLIYFAAEAVEKESSKK